MGYTFIDIAEQASLFADLEKINGWSSSWNTSYNAGNVYIVTSPPVSCDEDQMNNFIIYFVHQSLGEFVSVYCISPSDKTCINNQL